MQTDALVYVSYPESVGDLQIHVLVPEIGIEFVGICAPSGIGHLHEEPAAFLPCTEKDSDAGVLARDAVPDRIFYQRLQISVSGWYAEISSRISWRKRSV